MFLKKRQPSRQPQLLYGYNSGPAAADTARCVVSVAGVPTLTTVTAQIRNYHVKAHKLLSSVLNCTGLLSVSFLNSSAVCLYKAKTQTNRKTNNTSLSHVYTRTPIWSNISTSCRSHTGGGGRRGEGRGADGGLYVRLRVWKILDIWSMTGPVSGSFIHCVLFRGFSSISSKAAHRQKEEVRLQQKRSEGPRR